MIRHFHVLWALLGMHVPTFVARNARHSWRFYLLMLLLRRAYPALILALLLLQAITLGVDIAQTRNWSLAAPFCFALVMPVQFVLGYKYVRTRHFEIVLSDVECVQLSDDERYAYFPGANCSILTVAIVATLASITSMVLVACGFPAEGFDVLTDRYGNHWFLYTGLALHYCYTWSTLVLNLFQFNFVFAKQLVDFRQVEKAILDLMWHRAERDITKVGMQVNSLRFTLNEAVDRLQSMYTSMTLLGGLAIGVALQFLRIDGHTVFQFVLYALLQIAYLSLIYRIAQKRSDLLKRLQSPSILNKQWQSIESSTSVKQLNDRSISLATLGPRQIAPNSTLTYNDIIERHRNRLTPVEFRSVSSSPLQAQAVSSNAAQKSNQTPSTPQIVLMADLDALRTNVSDVQRSDIAIDVETIALLHRVNGKLDWSIVTGLLDKQWAQFSFLGYDFSDTAMIGKTAGLISALIVAGKVLSSLTLQ